MPSPSEYLRDQIANHISLFFHSRTKDLFASGVVRFVPYGEAIATQERIIVIPVDVEVPKAPRDSYKAEFNDTSITLWNRLTPPPSGDWTAVPNEATPIWFQNGTGTLIPAWNIFGNLFDLLTFGEEKGIADRDPHGRFAAAFSPRAAPGLLETPAFNEAVAVIVAAAAWLGETGRSLYRLDDLLQPPAVILSHDCDILLGNDIWTQAVRAARIVLPLTKLRWPRLDNIWWIIRNAATPRRFYFDNATGMVDLERCFGYDSTFYFLNGDGGRFGARSGAGVIAELMETIPPGWDVGMHYNYNTFLDDALFSEQKEQLEKLTSCQIAGGRAHYLRFDPEKSFEFLQYHGIKVDESSGYADRIGYRNGIAGCFQAYDATAGKPLGVHEVPLTIMDGVLVGQYGKQAVERFSELLHHLSRVGGALSLLFHPGKFSNPEHRQMIDVYHRILIECRQLGAQSFTARELVRRIH